MEQGAETLGARLGACADRIAQLEDELGAEHKRRDQMIIEMRDTGSTWGKIARCARLSISRCVAIVTSGP